VVSHNDQPPANTSTQQHGPHGMNDAHMLKMKGGESKMPLELQM
jgi:hypothetical protein